MSEPERGNMLPLALAALLVLFAVLAFSVDQGIAYAAKVRQENALDGARAACMDASQAFAAKSAEDPSAHLARLVAHQVRADGYEGRISVWFYEEAAERLPATERLWAVGMQLEERVPTAFARGFGIGELPVASHRVLSAAPYAEEEVWRPHERVCGRWDVAAGARAESAVFTKIETIDGFPAELAAEVRAAQPEGSGA